MNELIRPSKTATITLKFMGPNGKPISGFGSSLAVDPWKERMKEIAREKKRKRIYKAFLVVQAIIIRCAKKVFLDTD